MGLFTWKKWNKYPRLLETEENQAKTYNELTIAEPNPSPRQGVGFRGHLEHAEANFQHS